MASSKVNKAFAVADWRFGPSFVVFVKVSTAARHQRDVFQKWGMATNYKPQQMQLEKKSARRWGISFDRLVNGKTKPERFFLSVDSFLIDESFGSSQDEYHSIKSSKKKAGSVSCVSRQNSMLGVCVRVDCGEGRSLVQGQRAF